MRLVWIDYGGRMCKGGCRMTVDEEEGCKQAGKGQIAWRADDDTTLWMSGRDRIIECGASRVRALRGLLCFIVVGPMRGRRESSGRG